MPRDNVLSVFADVQHAARLAAADPCIDSLAYPFDDAPSFAKASCPRSQYQLADFEWDGDHWTICGWSDSHREAPQATAWGCGRQ